MSMDIGSAFTYVFDDEDWLKKLAIGGGIVLLGAFLSSLIIGIAALLPVYGYMIATLRNVRDSGTASAKLPEWSDFGELFKDGGMYLVISIVYNIPVIIMGCAIAGGTVAATQIVDPDTAGTIVMLANCLYCLIIIVALACNLLIPAAVIRFAQYNTLGSAFQVGAVFNFIKENIGDYIIVFLVSMVAGMIASFGLILCGVGVFFTTFWAYLVTANLYGQLARHV